MIIGARIRWRARRGAPLREGIVVVEVPSGVLAIDALAMAHREQRFADGVVGPCTLARVGATGSKYFCGYFAVTQRMIDLAGDPSL